MLLSSNSIRSNFPECFISEEVNQKWKEEVKTQQKLIIVIDDDPTGIQTVYDVPVYWSWSHDLVIDAFQSDAHIAFFQTNSRAMTAEQAQKTSIEIMQRIIAAANLTNREFSIISRSDSTLRGHYPLETSTLYDTYKQKTGKKWDAEILIPFFLEGGRITVDDIHYVNDGDRYLPVGETEFADDKTFPFQSSDLKGYIEEKYQGKYQAKKVVSIPLSWLRSENIQLIYQTLVSAKNFSKIIVNAVSMDDLKVFVIALRIAENNGKTFLFRTAASFVKCYGGLDNRPLLNGNDLIKNGNYPGIVVVGSHTLKTTRQLENLLKLDFAKPIEIDVNKLIDSHRELEIERVIILTKTILEDGFVPVLYTSRILLTVDQSASERNLELSMSISNGLVDIIKNLPISPSFMIAKGGITSSELGSKGLKIQKATVLGQIRKGVPVIKSNEESKRENLPYIIFPGNVGTEDDLREVVSILYESYKKISERVDSYEIN